MTSLSESFLTLLSVVDSRSSLPSILVGASGVGKSSLLNALLPGLQIRTNALTMTGQGKHTTTAACLYQLETGGNIVDTPGAQSHLPPVMMPDRVQATFPEIENASQYCRLQTRCTHTFEASLILAIVSQFPVRTSSSSYLSSCYLQYSCLPPFQLGCAVKEAAGMVHEEHPLTMYEIFRDQGMRTRRVKAFYESIERGDYRTLKFAENFDPVTRYGIRISRTLFPEDGRFFEEHGEGGLQRDEDLESSLLALEEEGDQDIEPEDLELPGAVAPERIATRKSTVARPDYKQTLGALKAATARSERARATAGELPGEGVNMFDLDTMPFQRRRPQDGRSFLPANHTVFVPPSRLESYQRLRELMVNSASQKPLKKQTLNKVRV